MNVVTFACTEYTDGVQAQLVRDLMLLQRTWDIALWDPKKLVPDSLLEKLNISRAGGEISLCICYKTGEEWPKAPSDVPVVERNLSPKDVSQDLLLDPRSGPMLKPQGKGVTNRTEYYLNRAYPKGQGIVNPYVTSLWGKNVR